MSKNPFSFHGAIINAADSRGRKQLEYENEIMEYEYDRDDQRIEQMVDSVKYLANSMVDMAKTFSEALVKSKPSVTINIFVQSEEDIEKAKSIIGGVIE